MALGGVQLPPAALDAMVAHFDMTRTHELTFDAFLLLRMKLELYSAGFASAGVNPATGRASLSFSDFLALVYMVPELDKGT